MKFLKSKTVLILFSLINLLNIIQSVKLLNATELSLCQSTENPESKEFCIGQTYTEIVCCFYQMTFPIEANLCNGASKSSKGLKSDSAKIILAGDIRVQGSLDCNSFFINNGYMLVIFINFFLM